MNEHSTLVQSNYEFLIDALTRIDKAKKRIWGQTLDWSPEHPVDSLFHRLKKASQRGIDVSLTVSHYGNWTLDDRNNLHLFNPFTDNQDNKTRRRLKDAELQALIESGVEVFTSKPQRRVYIPWHQWCVDHSKAFGVDDVAWIMTLNLTAGSFVYADKAIRIGIPEVVSEIQKVYFAIRSGEIKESQEIPCNEEYRLIIDHNLRGRDSLIYKKGLEIVEEETTLLQACAMLPYNGEMLNRCIDLAKRKIPVEVILSNWDDPLLSRFPYYIYYANMRRRIKDLYPYFKLYHYKYGTNHLKVLAGTNQVYVGSCNMDQFLADHFPPDEIQLQSTDPHLVTQMKEQIESLKRDSILIRP